MIQCMSSAWTSTGADIATMATGVSALAAAAVWLRGQWRDWRARIAATRARNWNAYIEATGIWDWPVTLVREPATPNARVVLQVSHPRTGEPDEQMAEALRRVVQNDGRLASAPSQDQMDFLVALRNERFGTGYPVR